MLSSEGEAGKQRRTLLVGGPLECLPVFTVISFSGKKKKNRNSIYVGEIIFAL